VDGFVVNINDRILVWKTIELKRDICRSSDNTWNRSVDFSIDDDVFSGLQVYVTNGSNSASYYLNTP
jgi:hypothetical protein